MKEINKLIIIGLLLTLPILNSMAQVAVNTDASVPDNSAMLDVKSTAKGFLPPRMTTLQRNAIALPATGLVVFDTDINSLFTRTSSAWVQLGTASTWGLTGNAGTTAATNFIGTTDNNDIIIKRNNERAGYIGLNNTSFGTSALNPSNTGLYNTAIGGGSLLFNTSGNNNTATGNGSLLFNTTGYNNTAIGVSSLRSNTTGFSNTANGTDALYSNTAGLLNTAF